MSGGGAARAPCSVFPLWVNMVDGLAALQPGDAASPCSLLRLRDIFRCDVSNPQERWHHILLSSYHTDMAWLLATVPELSAVSGKLVLLSGEPGTATLRRTAGGSTSQLTATSPQQDRANAFVAAWRACTATTPPSRDRFVVLEPPLPLPFGTHHTKMALCVNGGGVRVAIFTANLVEQDWCSKAQGIYVQDFPWATTTSTALANAADGDGGGSLSRAREFAYHLRCYLRRCGVPLSIACASSPPSSPDTTLGLFDTDFLAHIDFSAAAVWLVSSVPGTHAQGEASPGFRVGLCRLAEVLRRIAPATAPASVDLSWQYSSQGSLNTPFVNSLQAAMCGSAAAALESGEAPDSVREVRVVYPTEEEVRCSWEGWRGGSSLPLRVQCCHAFINERLHRWGGGGGGGVDCTPPPPRRQAHASRDDAVDVDGEETAATPPCVADWWQFAVPHIKSYAAVQVPDRTCVRWLLLTSANLSQAAWGRLLGTQPHKRGPRSLQVRSYELGVLYDADSAVDATVSPRFSVVAQHAIVWPTPHNSRQVLFETPLGTGAPRACLYLPYNLLHPTPYASTASLRAQSRACRGAPPSAAAPLDCTDVPWVVDMPHRGADAYGREVDDAFDVTTPPPPLHRWQQRSRTGARAPVRGEDPPCKRTRHA